MFSDIRVTGPLSMSKKNLFSSRKKIPDILRLHFQGLRKSTSPERFAAAPTSSDCHSLCTECEKIMKIYTLQSTAQM